jgi:hypothetical protein
MLRPMYSRMPGSGAVILIADSGMLMGEVMQSSRPPHGSRAEGRITSLLWALHRGGAVLLLPRHVLDEVERDLPRRATQHDNVESAYQRLRTLYLPRARIVDVPEDWGNGDPRVEAVEQRHAVDAPTARLAVALGYSFLLAEDPDLCAQAQLGFSAWLQVAHAAANETEVEMIGLGVSIPVSAAGEAIGAASRRIAASSPAAKWVMLAGLLILAAGAAWWVRSGNAGKFIERARPVLRELGDTFGPPLAETFTRYETGKTVFAQAAVPPANTTTLAERIARVLVFWSSPALAEDIARELEVPGNLRDRTRLVRSELRGCKAFTEVTRGRWMLGDHSGYVSAPLPPIEIVEYHDRLHKNIQRPHKASPAHNADTETPPPREDVHQETTRPGDPNPPLPFEER